MDIEAFNLGFQAELTKIALDPAPAKPAAPAATPSPGFQSRMGIAPKPAAPPTPTAPTPASETTPNWLQTGAAKAWTGLGRFSNWTSGGPGQSTIDSMIRNDIHDGVQNADLSNPKSMAATSAWDQAKRNAVADSPLYSQVANNEASMKAQDYARTTPVWKMPFNSPKLDPAAGDQLQQQMMKHVTTDPTTQKNVNGYLANRTYGAVGAGPGLESKFTPGNFQFGNFVNDHWGKLLAGGGIAALLAMLASRGNDEDQQHRQQPITINNNMGGPQPKQPFAPMAGYQ